MLPTNLQVFRFAGGHQETPYEQSNAEVERFSRVPSFAEWIIVSDPLIE